MEDPSKGSYQEYLRLAIDAEIKSLEESGVEESTGIRALRQRRNALVPASSLPTELISAIFFFIRFPGISSESKPEHHLAWLHVTHVCHQWREIALDLPHFWSRLDYSNLTLTGAAEILARAKKAPLYLEARVPSGHWDDARFRSFQKELQDRVPHICHLTISAEPLYFKRTLEGLVSPAPTLEYLSLLSCQDDWTGTPLDYTCVPDTLFDGTAPRLSRLELSTCKINWKSPILKGLKHLDIRDPFSMPWLSEWLDALDEMQQLETLVLHLASLDAPQIAQRTVTLPSLTLFEISCSAGDCGLAIAHLILPALTSLCLILKVYFWDGRDARELLPHVTRLAHGPQDTQPLQSMLFRIDSSSTEILAWTLPDINAELPDPATILNATMHSARVALSITYGRRTRLLYETKIGILDAALEALHLDGLVTLTAQNPTRTCNISLHQQFWLHHSPRWPLLRRMCLSPCAGRGFKEMLLKDYVGSESPLLPSLTELILLNTALYPRRTRRLCDALMIRVEQGVPLETLDLRTCRSGSLAIELLGEIVVDVLGPEETFETGAQILSTSIVRGLHLEDSSATDDEDEDEDTHDTDSEDYP